MVISNAKTKSEGVPPLTVFSLVFKQTYTSCGKSVGVTFVAGDAVVSTAPVNNKLKSKKPTKTFFIGITILF